MKVKVSQCVEVGSQKFKVKYTPNLKVDQDWRGSADQRTGIIEIDPCCGVGKDAVLMHELLHPIVWEYQINISEDDIMRLANGLIALFDIEFDWADMEKGN